MSVVFVVVVVVVVVVVAAASFYLFDCLFHVSLSDFAVNSRSDLPSVD